MNKKKFIFLAILVSVSTAAVIIELPHLHSKPPAVIIHSPIIHPRLRPVSVKNPHILQLLEEYEKEIHGLMTRSQTPGAAIAIVKDSSIIYLKG